MSRVRFLMQQATDQSDGAGGYVREWVSMGYVWGEFKNSSGNAGDYEGKKIQYNSHKAILFNAMKSGLRESWRLFCDGRSYEVIRVFDNNSRATEVILRSLAANEL